MSSSSPPRRNGSSFFLFFLIVLVLWFFFAKPPILPPRPDAVPRPVEARGDLASDEKSTIEIFQRSAPAVVYITTSALRRDFFSLNVYEIPQGTGSGFIWDSEGHIVTNYHVVEGANRVDVTLNDGKSFKASVIGVSPEKDIAVLFVNAPVESLPPIIIGESRNLLVGQKVFAIGNPFGLDHTMTSGIVSALGREIKSVTGQTIRDVIQTDAAINPGNSGGPLLDSAGRLVGVNTAIYSQTGESAGIGFAVPVEVVNRVVPDLIKYGKAIRPGIGVTIANDTVNRRLKSQGVLVINVQPGSAAEKSGIIGTYRENGKIILGDIVESINGVILKNFDDLRHELDNLAIGQEVILGIIRGGEHFNVTITLEEAG
ncbi:MAG: trypsin-like peptidase domain-containing protein [Proteobacteria bacterium]|nr:trypsin-like serine protease [Desulfobulbaceae bacterium]MBU4153747.1 trypsin-like peptidase domain-containing protein [Pseudomonadota bacterium]